MHKEAGFPIQGVLMASRKRNLPKLPEAEKRKLCIYRKGTVASHGTPKQQVWSDFMSSQNHGNGKLLEAKELSELM